jgi:hypothetical protein
MDSESGLAYARARMYSAKLGRFVNRDPIKQFGINFAAEAEREDPVDQAVLSGARVPDWTLWVDPPMAGDGYQDGLSLYAGYFAGVGLDPLGLACMLICDRCTKSDGTWQYKCTLTDSDGKTTDFDANTGTNMPPKDPKKDPYGPSGPLPPGDYDLPSANSPKFSGKPQYNGPLPSPTTPGLTPGNVKTPGGSDRSGLRIHGPGRSDGCITCSMDKWKQVSDCAKQGGMKLKINDKGSCDTCPYPGAPKK